MRYHPLSRATVHGRRQMAEAVLSGRLSLKEAAAEFKLSRQSAAKWVRRFREEGVAGLADRSSRPARLWHATPAEVVARVEHMRRERWTGLRIAAATGLSTATVSRILTRLQLNKVSMIEPKPPPVRYEHAAPGDLLHIDIKKFARIVKPGHRVTGDPRDETRGAGWEFLFVAVDDHSRIAFTAIYPNEKASLPPASLQKPSPTSNGLVSPSAASSPTTAPASSPTSSAKPAAHSASHPNAPATTARRPTARPNASSRPPSENGPTPDAKKTPQIVSTNSCPGPTSTTGIDRTPASNTIRPSQDQASRYITS